MYKIYYYFSVNGGRRLDGLDGSTADELNRELMMQRWAA